MRVLITGISGFAARHFIEFLSGLDERSTVAGIYHSNRPAFAEGYYPNVQCSFHQVNLVEYAPVEDLILQFKPEYILHLAAKSSVADSWINPTECILENTQMFLNLIEVMRTHKLTCRLLSVGSSEEYGSVITNQTLITEDLCTNAVSPYGAARSMQQKLVDIYSKNYAVDILHARAFNHLGAYQKGNFVISSFARQIAQQIKLGADEINLSVGDVSVVRDFTHVRDVVRAYYKLLLQGKNGETYNVCSGRGYVLKELINLFGKITGKTINYHQDVKNLRPNENKKLIGSNEKIKEAIGWQPLLPIEASLKDLLNYWTEMPG
jgi:GDP-4-dehydro-6-deoxy-D-mannose reductase